MDLDRLIMHAQQIEAEKLKEIETVNKKDRTWQFNYGQNRSGEGNHSQFKNHSAMPALSSACALAPINKKEQWSNFSMSRSQNSVSGNANCGKTHLNECLWGRKGCYGCSQPVKRIKECPHARQGNRDVRPQTLANSEPAPLGSLAPHQGTSIRIGGGQRQNRFYILPSCKKYKDSPDVVTGSGGQFQQCE
ncbi:uncharacterized protein LOC124897992 [Capsicum annuum]|uniref:uncharacterized protein LOC124897992 n=1 Tax=Capsicum annuum TaxID=4072 RepID=UPI001FB0D663|nr:uncharacterized protein LOC124897992 [Capsicum annuum]